MVYKTETTWAKRTQHDNGVTVTRTTLPKAALDLGLKVAGAAAMYGIGRLVGEGMDHIPYLNEWIPQAVTYVSAIDIRGNIDGLVGLLGGINLFQLTYKTGLACLRQQHNGGRSGLEALFAGSGMDLLESSSVQPLASAPSALLPTLSQSEVKYSFPQEIKHNHHSYILDSHLEVEYKGFNACDLTIIMNYIPNDISI